jgi:hypothetical protein
MTCRLLCTLALSAYEPDQAQPSWVGEVCWLQPSWAGLQGKVHELLINSNAVCHR